MMAINLKQELVRYGCEVDVDDFRDIVREMKTVIFPHWSDEELTFHLDESRCFVDAVRSKCRCPMLPDHLILRTLCNKRKSASR